MNGENDGEVGNRQVGGEGKESEIDEALQTTNNCDDEREKETGSVAMKISMTNADSAQSWFSTALPFPSQDHPSPIKRP